MIYQAISFKRSSISLAMLTLLVACGGLFSDSRIERLYSDAFGELMLNDPLTFGQIARSDSSIDVDYSKAAVLRQFNFGQLIEKASELEEKMLQSKSEQSDTDINLSLLEHYIQSVQNRDSFNLHQYPISASNGPHLDLPLIFSKIDLSSKKQVEQYLELLENVEQRFGQLIDELEERRRNNIVAPTFILTEVRLQCDDFVKTSTELNPFYSSFEAKLNSIGLMEPSVKQAYLQKCSELVSNSVIPAYVRLSKYLSQLERTSFSIAGVWRLESGAAFYRQCLKWHNGTEINPSSYYSLGKVEMARIEKELSEVSDSTLPNLDNQEFGEIKYAEKTPVFRYFIPAEAHKSGYKLYCLTATETSETVVGLTADRLATAKMIVDIGIHQKRWLREQAINYLQSKAQLDLEEATMIVSEIVSHPGELAAEKIGQLKLLELRKLIDDKSEENLDEIAFREMITSYGPLPLDLLKEVVLTQAR